MDQGVGAFFLQDDPCLNEREAWMARDFPSASFHFFKQSGCMMTSLWNMLWHYRMPGLREKFPTPWELNEACKAQGAFYENANIELARIDRVVPVKYTDRYAFDKAALEEELNRATMCLLRVKGENSPYHYVLPMMDADDIIRCFDPKAGYTKLRDYDEIFQIIRFQHLW